MRNRHSKILAIVAVSVLSVTVSAQVPVREEKPTPPPKPTAAVKPTPAPPVKPTPVAAATPSPTISPTPSVRLTPSLRSDQPTSAPAPGAPRRPRIVIKAPRRLGDDSPAKADVRSTASVELPAGPITLVQSPDGRDPGTVVVGRLGDEHLTLKQMDDLLALYMRNRNFVGTREEIERERRMIARRILGEWRETKALAAEARARSVSVTEDELNRYAQGTAEDSGLKIPLAQRMSAVGVSARQLRESLTDAILGDKLIRAEIHRRIPDSELRKKYDAQPDMFWLWPQRHVHQIIFPLQGNEAAKDIDAMERRMKRLRFSLRLKGSNLANYDKTELGAGPAFRDLGWFSLGQSLPLEWLGEAATSARQFHFKAVFQTAAAGPGKPPEYQLKLGEISEVLRSPYGFHLLQVVEEQPARRKSFEEARVEVENVFYEQTREQLIAQLLIKYNVQTNLEGLSLDSEAKKPAEPERTGRGGPSPVTGRLQHVPAPAPSPVGEGRPGKKSDAPGKTP